MVRTYKKKVGARCYRNYSDEQLQEAVKKVASGGVKFRDAVKQYKVSTGTLVKYVREFKQTLRDRQAESQVESQDGSENSEQEEEQTEFIVKRKKCGHPVILGYEDEALLVDNLIVLSEWGFPLDIFQLRLLTKSYLDARGLTRQVFKNNLPGRDWALSFLKRHKHVLTQRMCQNIKAKRAKTSREDIEQYFANLTETLAGVPDGNVLNYDETNLVNDPKNRKMIFKTKIKRPERVITTQNRLFRLCLP